MISKLEIAAVIMPNITPTLSGYPEPTEDDWCNERARLALKYAEVLISQSEKEQNEKT
jgi:hypothetical protein